MLSWSAVISLVLLTHYASVACNAFTIHADADWENFKHTHNKNYSSAEETHRKLNFQSSMATINSHNQEAANGRHSFLLGTNKYSDLTNEEIRTQMNGYKPKKSIAARLKRSPFDRDHHHHHHSTQPPPTTRRPASTTTAATTAAPATAPSGGGTSTTTVDWRTQGYVTPVKDQGQCGSCWAFSATGALEGQHFKKTGQLVSLSEQDLVSCDNTDDGCNGGYTDNAFRFIISKNGIDTESSYPYTSGNGRSSSCRFSTSNIGATLSGVVDITSGSESALQQAVATIGPVSVAIDASHNSFQLYKSGIYYESACSSRDQDLDHAVLVVGYGTQNGQDYWLVKNSWGTSWGMQGYMMMSRNRNNNCGIATDASYPTV